MRTLPQPECKYGYTQKQLERILGDRISDFDKFMNGQTGAICNGQEYNYDDDKHEMTGCGPHGYVVYKSDLEGFLNGNKIWD